MEATVLLLIQYVYSSQKFKQVRVRGDNDCNL